MKAETGELHQPGGYKQTTVLKETELNSKIQLVYQVKT